MYLPFSLSNPVSRQRWNYHNKPIDTLKVQMGLEQLGFMEPRDDDTYVSTDSDQLFSAMKEFQQANDLKVDGIANPDGPTHQAMNRELNRALAASPQQPTKPLIPRPVPAASAGVQHKNQRDIRVLGKRSDPGDFPVLMAQTLLSKNGEAAAPEVADLLRQIYAKDPDMGRKARAELAGVVDETSMRHLDDAAKIPPEDREPPQRPKEPEPEDKAPGIGDRPTDGKVADMQIIDETRDGVPDEGDIPDRAEKERRQRLQNEIAELESDASELEKQIRIGEEQVGRGGLPKGFGEGASEILGTKRPRRHQRPPFELDEFIPDQPIADPRTPKIRQDIAKEVEELRVRLRGIREQIGRLKRERDGD